MPCYHPMDAFQTLSGSIQFHESKDCRPVVFPCGQCIGCRLKRSRNWAIRCMHEKQSHALSSFVTLTYKYDYVPSLDYRDFQLFMKRLRKEVGPSRFFAVGEYGDDQAGRYGGLLGRPHFHALLFGTWFDDRKRFSKDLFTSDRLARLWPHGFSSIGDVTFQSAGYCARYCCEKVTGARAEAHYKRVDPDSGVVVDVVPEMAHMSLRPAIGRPFFERYWREMSLARDGVVVNGKTYPLPRYYDKVLDVIAPDLCDARDYDRYINSQKFAVDCTPERLLVREVVEQARFKLLKREL
ncbi:replication initiator protein [robinz microvirus RP_41]|nr:replication initiator protein [robinz microvirus RP_41]